MMSPVRVSILFAIPSCLLAQFQGIGGPTTLGSGRPPSNSDQSVQTGFRPYFAVSQVYDSELPGALADPNSTLGSNTGAFGVEAMAGVSGYHRWKHTLLELN